MKWCFIKSALFSLSFICSMTWQVSSQWTHIGLDGIQVNSIVFDDTNRLIAGTEKGLGIYINNNWEKISLPGNLDLPVTAIVSVGETGKSRIIVAAGNGSKSDGIFVGDDVLNGPPFYSLSLIDNIEWPQALAKTEKNETVFVGCPEQVQYCKKDGQTGKYGDLVPIKIPDNAFGNQTPQCGDLIVYGSGTGGVGVLYAGGFDMSADPGTAFFLRLQGEAMVAVAKMNISVFTEGIVGTMPPYERILYIGTIDSGIYSYRANGNKPEKLFGGPVKNEPVVALIGSITASSIVGNALIAAVKSGVYIKTSTVQDWNEIGNIPAVPSCLVVANATGTGKLPKIYAGSENGVYCFDTLSVPIKPPQQTALTGNLVIQNINCRTQTVSFVLSKPGRICVEVLDCAGRTITTVVNRYFKEGSHSISWSNAHNKISAHGVYIVNLSKDGKKVHKKFTFAQ